MKIIFSWDDGALEDQKLFELHEKYKIPGMFFVPTFNREGRKVLTKEMIRSSESEYVQFGGHTQNHTYLTSIPLEDVEEEVLLNKNYLQECLGHEIKHFCLPGGKYTKEILPIVYRHFETIRTADTMNFKYEGGLLVPTIHFYPRGIKSLLGNAFKHNSYEEMLYVLTHGMKDYFDIINGIIQREKKKEDRVIVIWGHSCEIEQYNLWDKLEQCMELVKNSDCYCRYSDIFK